MKKEVINDEQFESLYNMLNSSDNQNVVLGLVTLENVDFTKSLTKILLLKKLCNVTPEYW
jgi:NADH:ubiquinone oxidoreductase subunit C